MDRKTIVVICCSVLPILLITFVASRQTTKLTQETSRQLLVTHTDEELEGLLLTLSRAESAEQGYVLTGKEDALTPAIGASAEVGKHIRRLMRLLQDDPEQIDRLKELEPLIERRLEFIATIVITRKQKGFDAAVKLLTLRKDEEMSSKIKALVGDIEAGERKLTINVVQKGTGIDELKNQRLVLLAGFLLLFMVGSNVAFSRFG